MADELQRIVELLEAQARFRVPSIFPASGGNYAMPSGTNTFDFKNGKLTRGDGNVLGIPAVGPAPFLSLHIWSDSDLDMEVALASQVSGFWELDQCTYGNVFSTPFDTLKLRATLPFAVRMVASHQPHPPFVPSPIVQHQERYAEGTSADSEAPVVFKATGGLAFAQAPAGGNFLHTPNIGSKVFLIENTHGSNSLDAKVQVRQTHTPTGGSWFDDPDTGAAYTAVAAGNLLILESSLTAHLTRLMIRSTSAGNPATYQVQYFGSSAVAR